MTYCTTCGNRNHNEPLNTCGRCMLGDVDAANRELLHWRIMGTRAKRSAEKVMRDKGFNQLIANHPTTIRLHTINDRITEIRETIRTMHGAEWVKY